MKIVKIYKKRILLFLLCIFVLFVFSSCGMNDQDKEITELMAQYAEYWVNEDKEGMKSLHA